MVIEKKKYFATDAALDAPSFFVYENGLHKF